MMNRCFSFLTLGFSRFQTAGFSASASMALNCNAHFKKEVIIISNSGTLHFDSHVGCSTCSLGKTLLVALARLQNRSR